MIENKPLFGKKILVSVIFLFAIITALGLAFSSSFNNVPPVVKPTIAPKPEPTVEPIITPISTPNMDISSWKIYSNKEYGFELKYPEIFIFNSPTQDNKNHGIVGVLGTNDSTDEEWGTVILTIEKEKFDLKNVKIPDEEMGYVPYLLVDKVQSYIMSGGDGPCAFAVVKIPKGDLTIALTFSDCGASDNKVYFANDYRDQIVSTFRFTK